MGLFIHLTALLYLLSAASYIAYLFLQTEGWHRAGHRIFVTAFLSHTAAILLAIATAGHVPALQPAGQPFDRRLGCCRRLSFFPIQIPAESPGHLCRTPGGHHDDTGGHPAVGALSDATPP